MLGIIRAPHAFARDSPHPYQHGATNPITSPYSNSTGNPFPFPASPYAQLPLKLPCRPSHQPPSTSRVPRSLTMGHSLTRPASMRKLPKTISSRSSPRSITETPGLQHAPHCMGSIAQVHRPEPYDSQPANTVPLLPAATARMQAEAAAREGTYLRERSWRSSGGSRHHVNDRAASGEKSRPYGKPGSASGGAFQAAVYVAPRPKCNHFAMVPAPATQRVKW
jgi:hypothetical protein